MNTKKICMILALFCFLAMPAILAAKEELVLTGVEKMYITKISAAVLAEAYQQIGITFTTNLAPGERALVQANNGVVDGDLNRKIGLEQKYDNLIMIPVSVVSADWVVFTKKVKFTVQGWKSLQPHYILLQRGLRVAVDNTEGMTRHITSSISQVFMMLDAGRADVALSTRIEGLLTIKELGLSEITVLEPSLEVIPLYHYLHKKHVKIVPKLTEVLQRMEQQGEIKKIQEQVFQELLK